MDHSESDHAQTNRTIGSIEVTSISSHPISSSSCTTFIDADPSSNFSSSRVNHDHAVPHSLRRTPMFLPSSSNNMSSNSPATVVVPHHLSSSLRHNSKGNSNTHHHHRNTSNGQNHSSSSTNSTSNASSHHHLHRPHHRSSDPNHPEAETAVLSANMIKSGLYPVSGTSYWCWNCVTVDDRFCRT